MARVVSSIAFCVAARPGYSITRLARSSGACGSPIPSARAAREGILERPLQRGGRRSLRAHGGDAEALGRLQAARPPVLVVGRLRIREHRDGPRVGDRARNELEPFRNQLLEQRGCPGDVATGPREARDQPGFDRIAVDRHDDRNRRRGTLGRPGRWDARADDRRGCALRHRCGNLRQLVRRSPVHLDEDVRAIDPPELAQAVAQRA